MDHTLYNTTVPKGTSGPANRPHEHSRDTLYFVSALFALVAFSILLPISAFAEQGQGDKGYVEHPWYKGNKQGFQNFALKDTQAIRSNFIGCFQPSVEGVCFEGHNGAYGFGVLVDYYWPEVIGEKNNFLISRYVGGQLRDLVNPTKNFYMGMRLQPYISQMKDEPLQKMPQEQNSLPDPMKGYSTGEDSGYVSDQQAVRYEAHVYRTFFDRHLAKAWKDKDKGTRERLWADIITPYDRGRQMFFTEWGNFAQYWRLPIFSVFLARKQGDNDGVMLADGWNKDQRGGHPYVKLYWDDNKVPLKALFLTENDYRMRLMDPLSLRSFEAPVQQASAMAEQMTSQQQLPGQQTIWNKICASYRAAEYGAKALEEFGVQGSREKFLALNCRGPTQVFPAVGSTQTNSSGVDAVNILARMFEYTSKDGANSVMAGLGASDKNAFDLQALDFINVGNAQHTNYFDPYKWENSMWREPNTSRPNDTKMGTRSSDKLQIIYPHVTSCFRMKEMYAHNEKIFPLGFQLPTEAKDDGGSGHISIVHWNRRRACVVKIKPDWWARLNGLKNPYVIGQTRET